jgi:nitrate/nitrite transporter NarK
MLIRSRYNFTASEAGRIMGGLAFIGLFINPFVGTLIDRKGKRGYFCKKEYLNL